MRKIIKVVLGLAWLVISTWITGCSNQAETENVIEKETENYVLMILKTKK
jgi:hypothetical protein